MQDEDRAAGGLSPRDRDHLRRIALEAVTAAAERRRPTPPVDLTGALQEKRAAFVSVYVDGKLRGCMGIAIPDRALHQVVSEMSAAAATRDDRFDPISPGEVPAVTVEISVLGERVRVREAADVLIGRDGLVIEMNGEIGLLLPQVGTRWGWTAEEFLERTAEKAGLLPGAWKSPDACVFRFTADVF